LGKLLTDHLGGGVRRGVVYHENLHCEILRSLKEGLQALAQDVTHVITDDDDGNHVSTSRLEPVLGVVPSIPEGVLAVPPAVVPLLNIDTPIPHSHRGTADRLPFDPSHGGFGGLRLGA
jgi:hypothetical protein